LPFNPVMEIIKKKAMVRSKFLFIKILIKGFWLDQENNRT
jgi:hypothetical protein